MDDPLQKSQSVPQTRSLPAAMSQHDAQQLTSQPVQSAPPPVSMPHKEGEPIGHKNDMLQPVLEAPELSPELKEAGVDHPPSAKPVELSPDVASLGVELAKAATPMHTHPTGSLSLPLDPQQATQVMKTHPVTDSIRWLAEQVLEQLKRVHENLKE